MNVAGIAASALDVFGVDMMVRANNIANASTAMFKPQHINLTTGPDGQGVYVASINHQQSPLAVPLADIEGSESGRQTAYVRPLQGSDTDLATEFVRMSATQRAFEANVAVIRTHDDITGTLLDLKV